MTYLAELLDQRRADIAARQARFPLDDVRRRAATRPAAREFTAALQRQPKLAIVAEIKRASPSAGVIAADADAAGVAAEYEQGGAAALSVLTEPHAFRGSFEDLEAARAATSLPVLCKDFVVDEYQVWEAAARGADAILLIVAGLTHAQLHRFMATALACGMSPLLEVHDEQEAARALEAALQRGCAPLLGINNRDLKTMAIDTGTTLRVRRTLPHSVTVVAESGYAGPEELAALVRAGVDAVLIGESLMRESDKAAALRRLRGVPA